jgi:hypothetical protein
MDFMFFTGLQRSSIASLVVSYDIACQWHKNLWIRMQSYPPAMHIDHINMNVRFVVPKFHLPAHVEKCQTAFSLNLEVGMGRTDGEAPERGWANTNRISTSTKEMGPGSRRDILDDHFGDWNWKKVCSMGEPSLFLGDIAAERLVGPTLRRRLELAIKSEEDALRTLNDFEASLIEEAETLSCWKSEVRAWEKHRTGLNPYESRTTSEASFFRCTCLCDADAVTSAATTVPKVRLDLAEEELGERTAGKGLAICHDEVSPSLWVHMGLEIEQQQ